MFALHDRAIPRPWTPDALDPRLAEIGNTPLLNLTPLANQLGVTTGVRVLAKAEYANPTGSTKDRVALWHSMAAIRSGDVGGDRCLIESSSGNTGIAFAYMGSVMRFPVEIVLPEDATRERKRAIEELGARLRYSPAELGSEGAREVAVAVARQEPTRYFYANQYDSPHSVTSHRETTGPEVWSQSGGAVTHFVAGVGSGATITGVARYLRSQNPSVCIAGVEPDSSEHGLIGLKHLPTVVRHPASYDADIVDTTLRVDSTEATDMMFRLHDAGVEVGISSGAAFVGAIRLGREQSEGATVVVVLCDGFDRYRSVFEEKC